MPYFQNISAYKFAPLTDLKPLRDRLIERCRAWRLKGTILLSTEGINLFVAGTRAEIDLLLQELRSIPGLEDLTPKYSESDDQPFHRMLVKIKKEIISFGVEGIDPVHKPAPKLSARELKQWLDEGRAVTLLDTRNDYEVKLGTFQRAMTFDIDHFRQFPEAVRRMSPDMKRQPIVMFCTGGIRCEKAGPFMVQEGYEQIFQLDGGILKYFEECGSAHYDGECFVFDQRVGVDPSLHESEMAQCYACQTPLTPEDQADERFVEAKSCPYCFIPSEEQQARRLAERQATIQQVTTPLPGSVAYDNQRPLNVSAEYDGRTLLEFLCGILPHIPSEDWETACREGRLRRRTAQYRRHSRNHHRQENEPTVAAAGHEIVRAGERYLHLIPGTREPDVNVDIRILYEDEAIIVVHKPAPLPMHPCGRFSRNTLQHILSQIYAPQSPRPAHRLDANTTGLVLFTRTRHFAKLLQRQFERGANGEVEKRYLARVHGHPLQDHFDCQLPISDEASRAGAREIDVENGLSAWTEFTVLSGFPDGTSLLEVIPHTGRTNQIRLHLWALGHPICGDATYLKGNILGDTQTVDKDEPPLCLLAERISFGHPLTKQRMQFTADRPDWTAGTYNVTLS